MENLIGNIINTIFVLLYVAIVFGIAVRILKDRFSETKEISATVTDKQIYEKQIYFKSASPSRKLKHVVTFDTNDGEMHFEVSEFSYSGYHIGERGILKFKGTKIIDFR